ncbi:heptaprenyl diphosphate synthase component 1 [Staphylococcus americanisciuri]|uniref:Heptaprenyl diphosphate synthase component 1 n=1 Tax=Staphylococcus americanisciuri TaxID=2973940 RepID=A0ABT2EZ54_9STAP|nr:heptaprenyl diphosphate synthase component 1 [Staphylococcus americanisciuri]MCS4485462.1 heptaprenyl diphosphate synthase component 1 [Staphylococcus americanisciuri]
MQSTYQLLEEQINERLKNLQHPKNIHINRALSHVLDVLHIPILAKLACLSIDTSLKHLDHVSYDNYERDGILIGDLLSAHYYTLLADLNAPQFQLKMSQAIVTINELKSKFQHQHTHMSQAQVLDAIYNIETLLLKQLLDVYLPDKHLAEPIQLLLRNIDVSELSYLNHFDAQTKMTLIQQLQEKYQI